MKLSPSYKILLQGAVDTGQLLSSHPDIAKMSLTGSVAAGSKVMETCAKVGQRLRKLV